MYVGDLNRDQLIELKESYLVQLDNEGKLKEVADIDCISYEVLANINNIIPDDVVFNYYEGVDFTEDDFFCRKED